MDFRELFGQDAYAELCRAASLERDSALRGTSQYGRFETLCLLLEQGGDAVTDRDLQHLKEIAERRRNRALFLRNNAHCLDPQGDRKADYGAYMQIVRFMDGVLDKLLTLESMT